MYITPSFQISIPLHCQGFSLLIVYQSLFISARPVNVDAKAFPELPDASKK
ncbi:MAG: hypothetical protein GX187_06755 [Clostridiaceae bacterium]|nr:hypothetical protein [Clostridiaceae bacterium]